MSLTTGGPTGDIRPVVWDAATESVVVLDQTLLPLQVVDVQCSDVATLVDAISRLVVRGAPALGVTGAYGVALAMVQAQREGWSTQALTDAIDSVRNARPTAVNLAWGVDQVRPLVEDGLAAVLSAADRVAAEDEQANRDLSRHGADWLLEKLGDRRLRALTHCNTGSLATSTWGTGLGIIRELHARDRIELVYADETRPLLQGSRLTAWELKENGIPYLVQVDGAAASTITRGLVDFAAIGADRIAFNGDTANKIGSLGVALACADAGIPFVVAAPSSTVDLSYPTGENIEIELRPATEVTEYAGHQVAPESDRAFNPAFDVTPARLVSAVVTELGVAQPSQGESVERLVP
ncbi:MAG: S-methyl-5-thioribose-1-phosphate isomerase [Microbacteriaceae bacterium]|jgi:methylthioribose-1-phosphate isomerase|nr:S-methyl-5-thioribose-1-phosphate isomerase [Microbacteriaceae bacterium]MBT5247289.1 S-methyl-5-thioribose-1-phosphate isomerase [Microbacteriaceae bacterium]MBT5617021.1 S-methyl-5-thioribose-1-phosphate isomerase [Microbacteriaceae bacterium]